MKSVKMKTPGIGNRKRKFKDLYGKGVKKKRNVRKQNKRTTAKNKKLRRKLRGKRTKKR
jgi:hypothetical protein